jgi:Fe-S-cluster containining protein
MNCRSGCGACCIAPSIASPIPGMPAGKRAGQRCIHLTADNACAIFASPERPSFCAGLKPSGEMCGSTRGEAIAWLTRLEALTSPG